MLTPLVELSNRFRWVFCQLETLRHCLPSSVWHMLDELPESLDKMYERISKTCLLLTTLGDIFYPLDFS